jgi:ATPase subunit of ABC transporter with duplicated ATPase domains
MLAKQMPPSEGQIICDPQWRIGHVAQILDADTPLSGGQRVNQALSQALANFPDVLLLDEPSNHLDTANSTAMLRMLQQFSGTLIIVTHNLQWMDLLCERLWIIRDRHIQEFNGRYGDFLAEQTSLHDSLLQQRAQLKQLQRQSHQQRMQEQERASHARARGEKAIQERRWPTIKSPTKLARGTTTSVDKRAEIQERQDTIHRKLLQLDLSEPVHPAFVLTPSNQPARGPLVQISNGVIGYQHALGAPLHLSIENGERIWLRGSNGSGKSTLALAIAGDEVLRLGGEWLTPAPGDIGYLDQHYSNLAVQDSVLACLSTIVPDWSVTALRHHLSRFLFKHEGLLQTPVEKLSGGEHARLSLACIAARPPRLLILDEVSNNLDCRTRAHVIDILAAYPAAMLLISHDEQLVAQIGGFREWQLQ